MTPAQLKAISAYAPIGDLMDQLEREAAGQGPEAIVARDAFNGLYEVRQGLEATINRLCNGRELDVWAKAAPTSELLAAMGAKQ